MGKTFDREIKYAISYVIYNPDRSKFLVVKRPEGDPDHGGMWGLPAGSVKNDETYEEAIVRSGKSKLGVDLKIGKFIGRGNVDRDSYVLHMEMWEAEIVDGELKVPQKGEGTQYVECKLGVVNDILPAAKEMSLCCNIYLKNLGKETYFSL